MPRYDIPKKLNWFRISLIVIFLAAILIGLHKKPLEGVHWDSPIYLGLAKNFAETPLFKSYAKHAHEIAQQLNGNLPDDQSYSAAYWHFIRFGHIALLGSIAAVFGTDVGSILVATWFYRILLALGLILAVLLVISVAEMFGPGRDKTRVASAVILSAALYLASDVWNYMNGNLVSEVPAIFLLCGGAWTLVQALRYHSLTLAFVAGGIAFLLYVVNMEGLWFFLAFTMSLLVLVVTGTRQYLWWPAFIVSGFSALLLYTFYAWWFYPLADPRLLIAFAESLTNKPDLPDLVIRYKQLVVAGGFLWIGTLVAMRALRHASIARFAFGWLFLSVCPRFFFGLSGETRTLTTMLMLPLLLSSTLGWAELMNKPVVRIKDCRGLVIALLLVVGLFCIATPAFYNRLREVPGAWRLCYVRNYLIVPPYQQNTYPLDELSQLSRVIYDKGVPTMLVWSRLITAENMNIIRFLGSSYLRDADLALYGDPTNKNLSCKRKWLVTKEPVVFCNMLTQKRLLESRRNNIRVLLLRSNGDIEDESGFAPEGEEFSVLKTRNFRLSILESMNCAVIDHRMEPDPVQGKIYPKR